MTSSATTRRTTRHAEAAAQNVLVLSAQSASFFCNQPVFHWSVRKSFSRLLTVCSYMTQSKKRDARCFISVADSSWCAFSRCTPGLWTKDSCFSHPNSILASRSWLAAVFDCVCFRDGETANCIYKVWMPSINMSVPISIFTGRE